MAAERRPHVWLTEAVRRIEERSTVVADHAQCGE
jgi:hypothetical protein